MEQAAGLVNRTQRALMRELGELKHLLGAHLFPAPAAKGKKQQKQKPAKSKLTNSDGSLAYMDSQEYKAAAERLTKANTEARKREAGR